jgi:hypothetical protein
MRLPSRSSTTASTSCVGAVVKRPKPLSGGRLNAQSPRIWRPQSCRGSRALAGLSR